MGGGFGTTSLPCCNLKLAKSTGARVGFSPVCRCGLPRRGQPEQVNGGNTRLDVVDVLFGRMARVIRAGHLSSLFDDLLFFT